MSYETMVEKIKDLPDSYYPELSDFVDTLSKQAQKEREDELENAIKETRADIAAGRFTTNLSEHLKRVGCI